MRRVPIGTRRIVVWVVWLGLSGPPMVRNAESKLFRVAYPPYAVPNPEKRLILAPYRTTPVWYGTER